MKPRVTGVTMVIDKGLGVAATEDLLGSAGAYIDLLKLGFGTTLLYGDRWLRRKLELAHAHAVLIYPGGTLLELAVAQGRGSEFVARVADLGFTALEVSEGTIELEANTRRQLIRLGVRHNLVVLSEVGKKDPSRKLDLDRSAESVRRDLDDGARWVIIEGRDSGRSVGVYDEHGAIKSEYVEGLLDRIEAPERLMWEAPTTAQQNAWLMRLGPNANFGNVQPADVVTLEATRQALRGDTLKNYVAPRNADR